MTTFFRLEDSQTELPKHYAYCDAFEYNSATGEWDDNRQKGFQVWTSIGRVVAVAAGEAMADGDYDVKDYPYIHIVKASEYSDGCDEWMAVEPDDVESDRVIETATLIAWCQLRWTEDVEAGYDAYEDDFESWCNDSEDEILEWAIDHSEPVNPVFVETLTKPQYA